MLIQNQQSQSHGNRGPIALTSNSEIPMQHSQPLSTTSTSFSGAQRTSLQESQPKAGEKQAGLKGIPNLVGVTTIEYTVDSKLSVSIRDLTIQDLSSSYLNQLFPQSQIDSIRDKLRCFKRVQLEIALPSEMLLEQVSIHIHNSDLFSKYLKVLDINKGDDILHLSDFESTLHLKSSYHDVTQKIIELNTCGVGKVLKVSFIFDKTLKPLRTPKPGQFSQEQKEDMFSKTMNVSDKIKNEILPLLNCSDDDIDELDDEVAMISNKKDPLYKDEISHEDIKIEIQPDSQKQATGPKSQPEDPERNFNTMPRNYLEAQLQLEEEQKRKERVGGAGRSIQGSEQEIFKNENDMSGCLQRLLSACFDSIKVTGFNCNSISAITNVTHFMNNSFLLKKHKYFADAFEIDLFTGVLMISTKRPTQAVEVFRKVQASYLRRVDQLQDEKRPIEFNKQNLSSHQRKTHINALLIKCAVLELLSAESMSSATQINEKLLALRRMVDLSLGKVVPSMLYTPQIHFSEDSYSSLLKILPQLLKFVILALTHKQEVVKMAACKVLEFVLETKGCSLDTAIVFILKQILKSYPGQSTPKSSQPNADNGAATPLSSCPSDFQIHAPPVKAILPKTQSEYDGPKMPGSDFKSIKEPQSGFTQALKNVYSHLLDTYISVLSSISSHILHQLFYEVILPTLTATGSGAGLSEIKVFAIKIAEKIITICQGDLILSKSALDSFLSQITSPKSQDPQNAQTATRNLWQSIRSKVFTNYSQKGLKILIDWLVDKMSMIAQNGQLDNKTGGANVLSDTQSDIAKLEITDEETQQLSHLFDIMTVISAGRKKNEEEANSLIKIKQEFCLELYLLINPLLFWLDFSVEREDRLGLFKSVYQTIKDVLDNLPPKKVDLDLLQIMIPILQRTTEYLKTNSPSQSMLKFLDIVLRDIKQGNFCALNPDLQYFFLDMLNNLVSYISYCLYEEIFPVFDKLLSMCADVVNEKTLTKCIVAMVDKYTLKSKAHKQSLSGFMKNLLEVKVRSHKDKAKTFTHSNNNNLETDELDDEDQLSVHSKNNYFEILCDFCFFNNEDPSAPDFKSSKGEFRSIVDQHDLYIDKLQFFIDSLSSLTEIHQNLFTTMLAHPKFKTIVLSLLGKQETTVRLKCHEIIEISTNYYVQYCTQKTVYELAVPQTAQGSKKSSEMMEVEFINHERLYVSQLVLQCVKSSLEQKNDSYLQFNSLILLDFLFQNLLPVPTYQNEQLRDRVQKSKSNQSQSTSGGFNKMESVLDLETLDINEATPQFEVTKRQYINMRLNVVFKLWPLIQQALNSAWSNIRSICYGLICSMLKIDIRDYAPASGSTATPLQSQFHSKLKSIVLPMLMNLLSSKESESKAGGLNILGSFCGLSYDFSKVKISKNLDFFKKNSQFISLSIWQQVFDLQDDWDITIKEASVVLIQLCAPRDAIKYFDRVKREKDHHKFGNMINKYGMGQMGSSRHSSNMYLNSNRSNEGDDLSITSHQQLIGKSDANITKTNNILSFLSGTDEMSMVLQMDQMPPFHQSDLFDQNLKILQNSRSNQRNLNGSSGSEDLNQLGAPSSKDNNKKILDLDADPLSNFPEGFDGADLDDSEAFNFFVDEYSDDQIQEIISIFRNDFKPPKNLWIEKNPTSTFNAPDYYADIFSGAIEQFNQQQAQLQQQQQQQLQQQVSGSPKASSSKLIVDAMEDDLVKKCEIEKKEKEKKLKQSEEPSHMIFERHFEDSKEAADSSDALLDTDEMLIGNIDAEPYKYLSSTPITPVQPVSAVASEDKKEILAPSQNQQLSEKPSKQKNSAIKPQTNLQLQIVDDLDAFKKRPSAEKWQQPSIDRSQPDHDIAEALDNSDEESYHKKTTDELIEEYERKINKTKLLLEEEKKRNYPASTKNSNQTPSTKTATENGDSGKPGNVKSTPEFKTKKENFASTQPSQQQRESTEGGARELKQVKKQAQTYLTELSKGYLNNVDNMKLIRQINNCFNDNSFNHFNIGPVVMAPSVSSTKHKQKLNKSFENLLAANKAGLRTSEGGSKQMKKNLSTSPKRGSSSGKKSITRQTGSSSQGKKKYLDQGSKSATGNGGKVMYNMRDLNFFIKTIEKDLSDKFSKLNMKDFNSMPTTPTSILKKVEDQVKAMAQGGGSKIDPKAYMSNTCPNMAQVLGSLDTSNSQKSNVLQISNIQNASHKINDMLQSSTCTPSNVSNHTGNFHASNGNYGQSQNSFSGVSVNNHFDKMSFSKTQKLDLKETNKNLFGYPSQGRDNQTYRDPSNEKDQLKQSKSPQAKEEKLTYANLLKSKKEKGFSTKRSRGSQDKYLIVGSGAVSQVYNSQGSSKLNKSLNSIGSNQMYSKGGKKEQLSKSMLQSSKPHQPHIAGPNGSLSPHANKKSVQQMIKTQLQNTSSITQQPPHGSHHPAGLLYDYIQAQPQASKITYNAKTPIKVQVKERGEANYSEILEVSPSSADKDYNRFRGVL